MTVTAEAPVPVEDLARDWDDLPPDQQRRWIRTVEVVRSAVVREWEPAVRAAALGQLRAETALAAALADCEALREQLGREPALTGSEAAGD